MPYGSCQTHLTAAARQLLHAEHALLLLRGATSLADSKVTSWSSLQGITDGFWESHVNEAALELFRKLLGRPAKLMIEVSSSALDWCLAMSMVWATAPPTIFQHTHRSGPIYHPSAFRPGEAERTRTSTSQILGQQLRPPSLSTHTVQDRFIIPQLSGRVRLKV